MPAVILPVDPARQDGRYLVADLPGGPVLLPGDVATVVDPDGRTGLARVTCVDLTRRCLHLAVSWPTTLHPESREVPTR
ncbi:hypothetical protein JNW90_00880 [Micromonospora sp. STR1s_5]|nr:hypothetical protein [Micromonospora sp. STR1s_5]